MTLWSRTYAAAIALALTGAAALAAGPAEAGDAAACKTVKFSDVGWTDITATTAVTARILKALGYEPQHRRALGAGHLRLDEEQGHRRLPRQLDADHGERSQALRRRQVGRGAVGANLEGAKYTLAVPTYTFDKGLKIFADIAKFKDKLDGKIYGIEPGNDGNRLILDMIKDDKFGLKGFELVEVERAGHAGAGRARRRAATRTDRVPRLGAAPDEHEVQDELSDRRRRRLRPELSAAPRSTPMCAPATARIARMSASCSTT